jgi:type I restriction enzyme M protein
MIGMILMENKNYEKGYGGAGAIVRRKLLHECDVYTLLRLPTGIFYAQGVKANVLFFDRKPASETPWTKKLWIYDLRTNKDFTLKTNTLKRENLDEFVKCYHAENRFDRKPTCMEKKTEGRWRAYSYDELTASDKANLDIFWLRDELLGDSPNLPKPDVLAAESLEDLRMAVKQFKGIADSLGEESNQFIFLLCVGPLLNYPTSCGSLRAFTLGPNTLWNRSAMLNNHSFAFCLSISFEMEASV